MNTFISVGVLCFAWFTAGRYGVLVAVLGWIAGWLTGLRRGAHWERQSRSF